MRVRSRRLPLQAPILAYAAVVVALGSLARLAESSVSQFGSAPGGDSAWEIAELAAEDLEGVRALAAAFLPPELLDEAYQASSDGIPEWATAPVFAPHSAPVASPRATSSRPTQSVEFVLPTYLLTPGELRMQRPAGWTYPPFDTHGTHGPPPTSSPRNVVFHLVDANDEPFLADLVEVVQRGADGTFHPNAYCMTSDPTRWTIGSPSLTPGASAAFEVRVSRGSELFSAAATIRRVAATGDLDLGCLRVELTEP